MEERKKECFYKDEMMADIVDKETRSKMMASIRGMNTKPELAVRRYLHGLGYRYRLHRKDLPGSPDLVMPRYQLAIFVHGCFWHQHEGCHYAYMPKSRPEFWNAKLLSNAARDQSNQKKLEYLGWRVLVIWECGLKHALERIKYIPVMIDAVNQYQEWPATPPRPSSRNNF